MALLILGGTTEAGLLAERVAAAGIAAEFSLAGRTRAPARQPLPMRIGGFGGIEGLKIWLGEHGTRAVVDATHPFAARISANAVLACAALGVPLCRLTRLQWSPVAGDRWIDVASAEAAVEALPSRPARVFLTVGRLEIDAFSVAPKHFYLVRTIDAPEPPPDLPNMRLILDRGPFDADAEEQLMRKHVVRWLVTKNSGGKATAGKLAAARRLGLPVVMIRRPEKPQVETFQSVDDTLTWIAAHLAAS